MVGSPIANRTRAEIEPLIGFFVNTLAAARRPGGRSAVRASWSARARRAALEAYAHQDLPFERLVEELRPERRLSHNPLFQVMFALQNAPLRAIELPGLTFSPVEFDFPATRFDLEVFFTETEGGLAVQLTYATDLFDAATIARLEGHLRHPAGGGDRRTRRGGCRSCRCWRRPSAISSCSAGTTPRRRSRARTWRPSSRPRRGSRPDAVAVASDAGDLTYAELDGRASRLARRLAAAGVGPEVRVALLAQRSPAMIVGLLGILKAGGAYVPLDPSYPADRLAWMLADSAVARPPRPAGAARGAAGGAGGDGGHAADRRSRGLGERAGAAAARPGQPRLRDVHLRLDRTPQGGGRHPSQHRAAGRGRAASPISARTRSSCSWRRSPSTPRRWRSGRRCSTAARIAVFPPRRPPWRSSGRRSPASASPPSG